MTTTQPTGNGERSQWGRPIPADEITRADLQGTVLAVSTVVGLVALACLAFLPHHLHLGTPGACALSVFGVAPIASAGALVTPAIKKLFDDENEQLPQDPNEDKLVDDIGKRFTLPPASIDPFNTAN